MSGKHTPTPWQARGAFISAIGSTDTYSGAVWGGIVHATPCEDSDSEGRNWSCGGTPEANAAFIVRAVNAHDDLVEALKSARTQLEIAEQIISGESFNDLQINAALAKAEAL